MFPLLFTPEGLGGGKFSDIWMHLVGLPLCPAKSLSSDLSLN